MTEPDPNLQPELVADPAAQPVADLTVPFADGVLVAPVEPTPVDAEPEADLQIDPSATVLITPGGGQPLEELARALIALADHPHDVEWRPRWGAFEVPGTLAQAYARASTPAPDDGGKKAGRTPAARKGTRTTRKKEGGNGG